MNPALIKAKLYRLALKMNPQAGTLNVRTAAATIGNSDTFTSYNLLRLTYTPLTDDQLTLVGAALADQYRNWCVLQADLDQANAPQPQPRWTITVGGNVWVIEKVESQALNQAWVCTCRLEQPA